MNLIEKIKLEDLSESQQDIAKQIGLESYRSLVQLYGGEYIYVAQEEKIIGLARNREIISQLKAGYSYKQLARQYRLSERYIRKIEQDNLQGK